MTSAAQPTPREPAPAESRPGLRAVPPPRTAAHPDASGRNLLAVPWLRAVATSRLYPGVLQAVVAAGFVLVGYQLLLGPDRASDNLGTALMWVLWWPLIPLVFLVLGRFWCAVCPFGTLSDLVQRVVGVNRPVPLFLKRYGIWIIDALFILITWGDHVWGIVESPWGSGVLLLLLTTAVVASGAFFSRRAFCRYLCPIGGMSGNYARTGMVALRADPEICKTCTSRAVCYNGGERAPACPLFTFARTMDTNAHCNLCMNCVKNCPSGALSLTVRRPTKELWFVRRARLEESFLAMAIMGIVLVQNVTMLEVWEDVLAWVSRTTGVTSSAAVFTLVFAVAVSAPVALLAAAGRVSSRSNGESTWQNFARFGYALIPLDIAGHIAHNLFHLLAEGKAVWVTALPLLGAPSAAAGSNALVGMGTIQVLQYAVLALGFAGSLYAAYRIARARHPRLSLRRRLAPYAGLIVLLGAVNAWLFLLPMAHRV